MPLLADKIDFAQKYVRTKEGARWSLKGREWVRDQFWLPADGWKLWRHPEREACADCLEHVGELIEHPLDNPTRGCACGGLVAEPILVTVLLLDRGDGKTFNIGAYALGTIFKGRNKSIAAIWASEDQGTQIFDETWRPSLEKAPELAKRGQVFGTPPQVFVPTTQSRLEVLATSHRSVTGRRRTHIIADEARDIEARTIMALLPSTNAMHGVECPSGHVQLWPEDIEQLSGKVPKTCDACGQRLVEWWPRIILASARGFLSGTERDWLSELEEELRAHPHPNYHLFASEDWKGRPLNPRKSAKVSQAIESVFGKLPSTKHYVAVEYGNEWSQKGEDVLTSADVKRVMDSDLHNEPEGSPNRAVAFLDTSTSIEKTSLVILCEDPERSGAEPWSHVYLSYLEFWWPGHGALRGARKVPEADVKRCLETVLPMYPHLVAAELDPAAGVGKSNPDYLWPIIMLREIRKVTPGAPWRKMLRAWSGGPDGADIGWDLYEERVSSETIRLQQSQEILDEHKGLMRQHPRRPDARTRVVDRNRSVMHQDITRALANACWLIKREQLRGRQSGSLAERMRRQRAVTAETTGAVPRRPESGGSGRGSIFGRLGPNSY